MKHTILLALSLAGVSFAFGNKEASEAASEACCDMTAECCAEDSGALVGTYEKISMALAADDLKSAKEAAATLSCHASCHDNAALGAEADKVANAASIGDARAAFKAVSAKVIEDAGESADYFVMTCPMAGADWIQTTKQVANPYYGSQMLRCGAVKKTVTAAASK